MTATAKSASKKAPTKKAADPASAYKDMPPFQVVLKVLAEEIPQDQVGNLPVQAQALLLEVQLMRLESTHFDANRTFIGSNFSGLVKDVLGCSHARVQAVMRNLRKNKVYSSKGRGNGTRYTFHGSDEARAVFSEFKLKSRPRADGTVGSMSEARVLTPAPPQAQELPVEGAKVLPDFQLIVVPNYHALDTHGASLARLLTDYVVAGASGDSVVIAKVILNLTEGLHAQY